MREIKHPKIEDISLAGVMYALSDPIRLEMICALAKGQSLTCGELYQDRPKSSMSYHFKILREAGLINIRVEGKEHFNTLRMAELDKRFPGVLENIIGAAQKHK